MAWLFETRPFKPAYQDPQHPLVLVVRSTCVPYPAFPLGEWPLKTRIGIRLGRRIPRFHPTKYILSLDCGVGWACIELK